MYDWEPTCDADGVMNSGCSSAKREGGGLRTCLLKIGGTTGSAVAAGSRGSESLNSFLIAGLTDRRMQYSSPPLWLLYTKPSFVLTVSG